MAGKVFMLANMNKDKELSLFVNGQFNNRGLDADTCIDLTIMFINDQLHLLSMHTSIIHLL